MNQQHLIDKVTYKILFLMLLSPLLSFITFGVLGKLSITYYFKLFTIFYGIIFIATKWGHVKPNRIYLIFTFYLIYLLLWSFNNGDLERRGIFQVFINKDYTSNLLILIIVYNTTYTDKFIKQTITVIKITAILAAIVSLVQFYNFSFLDAGPLWDASSESGLTGDTYKDRRTSIFGYVNPNELGLSYIPLLSLLIGYTLAIKSKQFPIYMIFGAICAFLSNGRYMMIGFLLICIQVIIVQKVRLPTILKYTVILCVLSFLTFRILTTLGYNFSDWYSERLLAEGSLQETTRYKAVLNFQNFFPKTPYFGTGELMTKEIEMASNAVGSSQIHVGYLAHLLAYGIIGSLFLFGFWVLLLKKLFVDARKTNYWGSFFAFSVFIWANFTLVSYSIFFYGLIFAFVFDKYFEDKYLFQLKLKNQLINNDKR